MTTFVQKISEQIWEQKYRLQKFNGDILDMSVDDTLMRIAKALSVNEVQSSYDDQVWQDMFFEALSDFKFLPAGRIIAGAGSGRKVTLSNCYTMGKIEDDLGSIYDHLKEAALTMKQGGGIGYCFSTLRPSGAHVKGVDADASGPLTFMDNWDSMCRTIMSAGERRGAMMATMHVWHPDIIKFIKAKADPVRLRNFNMSVLITDDFMEAVLNKTDFDLCFEGEHYETVYAPDLWDMIMKSTYDHAEPGVLFIDRINFMHNINYLEEIVATNPCGEKPMGHYASCLLGSQNLVMFILQPFTKYASIDWVALKKSVHTAIRMMDNVIEVSNYPLEAQKEKALADRQLGLGITGLADALTMMGIRYGSPEAVIHTERLMEFINNEAYYASIELAKERGPFPTFDADKFLASGFMKTRPIKMRDMIRQYGIRNALLTSIAPTGTISMYANNVSSGIEPIFAFQFERKILNGDGSHRFEIVKDYAVWLWEDMFGDKPLPDYFVSAQTLTPSAHIRMQAAAQKHVDSSISKTVNCPEDISFEDFKNVYMEAWDSGCKGCTTYRPNDVTGSILTVIDEPKAQADEGAACYFDPATGKKTCDS